MNRFFLKCLPFAGILLMTNVLSGWTEPAILKDTIPLVKGWQLQSSLQVKGDGALLSTGQFNPAGWYPVVVPSTVAAGLVANQVYPDPHFGMNLRSYPGMDYKIGTNFSGQPMSANSPFRASWWYRTEFKGPALPEGERCWLHFDGINFRANVWLNGKRIADSKQMAGAWRMFEFDVTEVIYPGKTNFLAVETFAPEPNDLAITFVDWNPAPPDKMMGIWREVYLTTSGSITMRHPFVETKLDLPSLGKAQLTVFADLSNSSTREVEGILRGSIGTIRLEQRVTLSAGEKKTIQFRPDEFTQLVLNHPRLWWPIHMGAPNLYSLKLEFVVNEKVSDSQTVRFGIRQITGELNSGGHLGFKVNGKNILIRGAGYTPEMLLRSNPERQEDEIRYVKDMNLNTIRLEGKLEDEHFLNYCDEQGILVLAGWCCCDHWEKWKNWDEEDFTVSAESLKDQIHRLRRHASLLAWMNGSDNPPPSKVEQMYIKILHDLAWPNPFVSSATGKKAEFSGVSGVKMNGPYDYVPPIYWYVDTTKGGAFGFNTETGPGPAVPPIESLRRMLPADKLWPINEYWSFHSGGGPFKALDTFSTAMNQEYGKAKSLEDYTMKAQALAYDSHRAMFEAFGRNKPNATGVIQWMLNNAWPSMIWHLYDYYLRPGGSYFGAKKACEPLHIQYSYDDQSIVVVNSTLQTFTDLKATVQVFNPDMVEKFSKIELLNSTSDGTQRILSIPEIPDLSATYFLRLQLEDKTGKIVSRNFYWLSKQRDVLDDAKSTWYYTPQSAFADFTALQSLPQPSVKMSTSFSVRGETLTATVTLKNESSHLAFFLRLKLKQDADGEEVLPVIWEDNYVSLLPGEERQIQASCRIKGLEGKKPLVELETWK
jgi:exo-1,4-beta-D-glucosaminidase